jgi:hypothetical protein
VNLRTIQFWAIYNSVTRNIIAKARTKKELSARWGDLKDEPWCVLVKMKGHYLPRRTEGRSA